MGKRAHAALLFDLSLRRYILSANRLPNVSGHSYLASFLPPHRKTEILVNRNSRKAQFRKYGHPLTSGSILKQTQNKCEILSECKM